MKKTKIFLSEAEWQLLVNGLNNLRTSLINEGRFTDVVDETLAKVITAPIKMVRVC